MALVSLGVVVAPFGWVVVFYGSAMAVSMVTQDVEIGRWVILGAQASVIAVLGAAASVRVVRPFALGAAVSFVAMTLWYWLGLGS